MVVGRRLVEGPRHRIEIDRCAPVQQPHVPALVEQGVDEGARQRRPEELGADARAVDDEDGAARRRMPALHVHDGERTPVQRGEGHDFGPVVGPRCRPGR
jgi:hypothetical protein